MGFEDEYARRGKKRSPLAPFLPILGLLMIVSLGAVAFVLSGPAHDLLIDNIANFPDDQTTQYMVGGAVFVLLTLVAGMLYAIGAPKPYQKQKITENDLRKERAAKATEDARRKKRKKEMNRKAAEERKKREQEGK